MYTYNTYRLFGRETVQKARGSETLDGGARRCYDSNAGFIKSSKKNCSGTRVFIVVLRQHGICRKLFISLTGDNDVELVDNTRWIQHTLSGRSACGTRNDVNYTTERVVVLAAAPTNSTRSSRSAAENVSETNTAVYTNAFSRNNIYVLVLSYRSR